MGPSLFHIQEHVVEGQHVRDYPHATARSQDEPLFLAVKQYVPRNNPHPKPGDVTIIGGHANGFPKEMYEPLWEDLVAALAKRGVAVRSIWVADAAWQGRSGRINKDRLGNDPSWFDYSRDLLHLINHFRAEMPRPLVGVGHSFGACALLHLSLSLHPRLLSTIVLLDPVLTSTDVASADQATFAAATSSARRRDRWPSRADAAAAFRRSRFYAAWDARVLEAWVRYGVCEVADGGVGGGGGNGGGGNGGGSDRSGRSDDNTRGDGGPVGSVFAGEAEQSPQQHEGESRPVELTTTKHQEVFTFLRPVPQEVNSLVRPSPPLPPSLSSSSPGDKAARQPVGDFVVKMKRKVDRALIPDAQSSTHHQHQQRFYRPEPALTLALLPTLRPGALFLFGGASDVTPPALREQIANMLANTGVGESSSSSSSKERRVTRVGQTAVPGRGHLVPFEAPATCAEHAADFVAADLEAWLAEEEEFSAWARRPLGERQMLDDDWVGWLTSPAPSRKETKL